MSKSTDRRSLIYVLPHAGFFSRSGSIGGHLAHSLGFVGAATTIWDDVSIVCAQDGTPTFESLPVSLCTVKTGTIWSRAIWVPRVLQAVRLTRQGSRPEACYVRYSAGFSWVLPLLKRLIGDLPLVLEINSLGSQRHKFMSPIDSRALCSADLIVVISDVVAQIVRDIAGRRCPPVLTVPNGVDLSRFQVPVDVVGIDETSTANIIGYVGVLKADYGLEELIAAFKIVRGRISTAELSIVGDGPLRPALEVEARQVDGVRVCGPVTFDSVPALLRSMEILVCPQSEKNAHVSPMKLFEYFAAGKPIIAAEIPQVSRIAAESGALVTYRCGDVGALADRICELLGSSDYRIELGRLALLEAQKHTWEARVHMVRDAITRLR